jgi:Family of unknown function (DUF6226)
MKKMDGHRWGAEGPPLEAYSRVTNPERFASLHEVAAELLDRLELVFCVERTEGYGLDPELEAGCKLARPSVTLVQRDVRAAPVVVAFSAFPGLLVRLGRWWTSALPTCGCDACDETAESETVRLQSLINNLTTGRFREAIQIHADGTASQTTEFWSAGERWSNHQAQLDRTRARQLLEASDRSSYDWRPWPKRS